MGLLCDYFLAQSDGDAAVTIDWVGGPSAPPPAKGLIRRRAATPPHRTVSLPGMEPTMWMGKLDMILTGRTFDEILHDGATNPVAIRDEGERLILPIAPVLQEALAALSDEQIEPISTAWAEPDADMGTGTDSAVAEQALRALAALVRQGRVDGETLYCWLCV